MLFIKRVYVLAHVVPTLHKHTCSLLNRNLIIPEIPSQFVYNYTIGFVETTTTVHFIKVCQNYFFNYFLF